MTNMVSSSMRLMRSMRASSCAMSVSMRSNCTSSRRPSPSPEPPRRPALSDWVLLPSSSRPPLATSRSSWSIRAVSCLLDSVRLSMMRLMDEILASASLMAMSLRLSDAAVMDSIVWYSTLSRYDASKHGEVASARRPHEHDRDPPVPDTPDGALRPAKHGTVSSGSSCAATGTRDT